MTKPLELKTFPLWESLGGTMYTGDTQDDVVNVDFEVYRKRLTDAELAAEVWHFDYEDFGGESRPDDPDEVSDEAWNEYIQRRIDAEQALKRFATLPHYDEHGYE